VPMGSALGQAFGRYENLTLLGRGGMGEVYRAHDPELGREVAIKVMLDATPEFLARFRREAQVIARLTHPNVVQVYDFGVNGSGKPYFVMELVQGTSLDKVMRERGRLPPTEAVRLARQAAEGLGVAHRAGIVHRDVKPSNLVVDANGHVKIVDFGIARIQDAGQQLTNVAMLMGTPGYMAPEQAMGRTVDQRAEKHWGKARPRRTRFHLRCMGARHLTRICVNPKCAASAHLVCRRASSRRAVFARLT